MSLVVEKNYVNGMPQTAVYGFTARGTVWHWTAGGRGRAGWLGSVSHMVNTRATVNASYHAGFWVEHDADHVRCKTFIQWVVPTTKAAHSVNPSKCWLYNTTKDRSVQEARFAEVRRILGIKATDPNAAQIALAYAGMPADLEADLACWIFRADLQNLARQMEGRSGMASRPHFGHGWIQPLTRYEMDVSRNFIAMLTGPEPSQPLPPTEEEDHMIYWKPVLEDWWTAKGTRFFDGDGNEKTFTDREKVQSTHESSDGRWRLVKYGNESLVVDARGRNRIGPGLESISGTRVPTTGYGYPPPPEPEVVRVEDTQRLDAVKAKVAALAAEVAQA